MPKNGLHTYKELVDIVNRGEAVMWNGKHITSMDDMPTRAEVAAFNGDKEETASTAADIAKRRADLDAEEAALTASTGAKTEDKKPEEKKPEEKK